MTSKILINSVDPEECRIAKVTNSRLEEFHLETTSRESIQGNIYKAVVTRVEPSLQAVFVDFGNEKKRIPPETGDPLFLLSADRRKRKEPHPPNQTRPRAHCPW